MIGRRIVGKLVCRLVCRVKVLCQVRPHGRARELERLLLLGARVGQIAQDRIGERTEGDRVATGGHGGNAAQEWGQPPRGCVRFRLRTAAVRKHITKFENAVCTGKTDSVIVSRSDRF